MKPYWKLSITCIGLAMALTLAGCGAVTEKSTNFILGESSGTGELVSEGVQTFGRDEFDSIDIVTEAMEIVAQQGTSDEATVEFMRDSSIGKTFAFDASIQGDVLQVTVTEKDKLLSVNDERGQRKLIVTLPAEREPALNITNNFGKVSLEEAVFSSASVQLDAGSIVASGTTGELDLKVDAGDIRVEKGNGSYPITAYAEAGSINITFAEAPAQASFELMVEVGKVQLGIDDVNYDENRNTVIKAERGSGGPLIKAITSVGNIRVN